jgi:hypothetical protein
MEREPCRPSAGTARPEPSSPGRIRTHGPRLTAVSAASATGVWAVGVRVRGAGDDEVHGVSLIEPWDGTASSVAADPGSDHQLQGVSATSAAAFAVGLRLTFPVGRTVILQH